MQETSGHEALVAPALLLLVVAFLQPCFFLIHPCPPFMPAGLNLLTVPSLDMGFRFDVVLLLSLNKILGLLVVLGSTFKFVPPVYQSTDSWSEARTDNWLRCFLAHPIHAPPVSR